MHPFGPPAVPGHFFMIVMTKTTNGVAVANFDSCEGCSTHMQLQTEIHKDRCTEFDLVGLIQVFFAINKDFRFPEKSGAECKTVFGKFSFWKIHNLQTKSNLPSASQQQCMLAVFNGSC